MMACRVVIATGQVPLDWALSKMKLPALTLTHIHNTIHRGLFRTLGAHTQAGTEEAACHFLSGHKISVLAVLAASRTIWGFAG